MELARRVARNTLYRTASLIVGNLSGLFLTIYLARILKPEQFGIYSLALSVAMIASAFANLGIDGAVVRYTAYYIGKGNLEKVRGHFRYFLRVKIALTSVISALLIIFSTYLASLFGDERLSLPFIFAGLTVFFSSLTNFLNVFFYGLQEFKYSFIRQVVYESSRWVFVLPLSLLFLASGAIAGHAIAFFISLIFLLTILLRKYEHYVCGETSKIDEKILSFIGFMAIAGISGILYAYVDSIMIGFLLTPMDVGYYKAAYTVVFAIVGLIAVADALFPTFTQLEGDLNNAVNRVAKYVSTVSFPTAILLMFFSGSIVRVIYGVNYLRATLPLTILSLVLIPASFSYLLTIFSAKEMPKYSAIISTFGMLLNVALNYILIKLMGISGAALATLISRSFVVITGAYLLAKVLDVKVSIKSFTKPFISALLMLFLLVLLPSPRPIIENIVVVTIAIAFYFILLFSLKGLSKEDIKYLISLFR